jgi:hypothetical protein
MANETKKKQEQEKKQNSVNQPTQSFLWSFKTLDFNSVVSARFKARIKRGRSQKKRTKFRRHDCIFSQQQTKGDSVRGCELNAVLAPGGVKFEQPNLMVIDPLFPNFLGHGGHVPVAR